MENNYRFFGTPRVKGFDSAGRVGVAKEKINNFLTRANMGDTISERDWKYLQRQQLIPLVRSVGQENPTAGRLLQSAARMLSRYTDNPKRQYAILKKVYYEVSSALYGMRQGGKSTKAAAKAIPPKQIIQVVLEVRRRALDRRVNYPQGVWVPRWVKDVAGDLDQMFQTLPPRYATFLLSRNKALKNFLRRTELEAKQNGEFQRSKFERGVTSITDQMLTELRQAMRDQIKY